MTARIIAAFAARAGIGKSRGNFLPRSYFNSIAFEENWIS